MDGSKVHALNQILHWLSFAVQLGRHPHGIRAYFHRLVLWQQPGGFHTIIGILTVFVQFKGTSTFTVFHWSYLECLSFSLVPLIIYVPINSSAKILNRDVFEIYLQGSPTFRMCFSNCAGPCGAFLGDTAPCPPPLVCRKALASSVSPELQRTNLIREVRKCRNKGKQSNKTK